MFGLSGIELAFCAVLALVLIGPQDLPKAARTIGHVVARCRRMYAEVVGSMARLERELELTEKPRAAGGTWQDYLPPEIKALRASIRPHSGNRDETAEKYRQVRQAVAKAKADFAAAQAPDAAEAEAENG